MQKGIISSAAADLRREPCHLPNDFSHNPLRESQLLQGERVRIVKKENAWLYIEAIEQPKFSENKGWHGYPGWVHESEVEPVNSFPIEKKSTPKLDREKLIHDAMRFLGVPYLWGGRSPQGVDCSGYVNLLYREQGIQLPRDAHDQCLFAKPLSKEELLPGDLIFLERNDKPGRITHVVIYNGEEGALEAPETGKCVRILLPAKYDGATLTFAERPYVYRYFLRSIEPSRQMGKIPLF